GGAGRGRAAAVVARKGSAGAGSGGPGGRRAPRKRRRSCLLSGRRVATLGANLKSRRTADVALDRQSIEKRDFPIGRRGYEPEAVDGFLGQLADEVEALQRAHRRRTTESLA